MLDPKKIKLGIAPIAWCNDDMPELGGETTFEQIIKEMAEAGYQGSEVGNKYPKDPAVLKKALAPYKLSIASQWFSSFFTTKDQKETIEAFKKHMAFLKAMGAKVIVISEQGNSIQGQMDTPLFDKKPVLDEAGWNKLAKGLETIGALAVKEGMKIVYHHHMGTVVQTAAEVDKLMAKTDPKLVWLLLDTGHMYYSDGGNSPLEVLEKHAKRIAHVHLKDIRDPVKKKVIDKKLSFLQSVKEGVFTVPGDGAVDFKPIFEGLAKAKYEGWFIVEAEQDPAKANPLEYAKKARAYIKTVAGL
ncbi:MAG: myo-inosose-2 dehydratase [Candidatus Sigynarchaeota archaeon]